MSLVSLQSLNLMRCTRVSDVGAGHLCRLPALAWVNLSECPHLSRDALDSLSWHVQVRWRLHQMNASLTWHAQEQWRPHQMFASLQQI